MGQNVLQAIEQCGLARADRPNCDLQALAAYHSFHHRSECVAMRLGKVKKAGIRR
jgi:hypothetical protein